MLVTENPFEESAKGQVAGMMQQRSSVIDIDKSKEIMEAINMLNFLEGMINKIAAVPQPRQGELQGNEGLGVSQEAIGRTQHLATRLSKCVAELAKTSDPDLDGTLGEFRYTAVC